MTDTGFRGACVMETLLSNIQAAMLIATTMKPLCAGGYVRLFKAGFSPTPQSVLADFVAHECDFTGYPGAVANLTASVGPILLADGSAALYLPSIVWSAAAPYTTGNQVGGYWAQDNTGEMLGFYTFNAPIQVSAFGQGVEVSGKLVYGKN